MENFSIISFYFRQVAFASGHTEAIGAVALSRKRTRYALSGEAMGAFAVTASKDRTLKKWTLPSSDILKKVDDASPIELNVVTSVRAHEKVKKIFFCCCLVCLGYRIKSYVISFG